MAMLRLGLLIGMCVACLCPAAHAVTVKLTDADGARVNLSIHPGDVLRIELPSEPAGGRQWSLQGHAPVHLTKLGATERVFGGRLSNQGASSFAWRALNAGESEIALVYGNAPTRANKPEKTFAVHVVIAGDPLGPEEAQPAAMSQLERFAGYQRTLPCADCSTLMETLLLYRAPGESPYVLRRTYQDAPGGTIVNVMTGLWSIHQGSYADPSATIYLLTDSGEDATTFQVQGDRLVPLDAQQIPVPSPPDIDNAFHKLPSP